MKNFGTLLFYIVLGLVIGLSLESLAQSDSSDQSIESLRQDKPTQSFENIQKVRKKEYPGGADEGDLKVQAALVAPSRKVAPVTELKEESTEE